MVRSYRASQEGLTKAKKVFELKGWTQDYLAGRASCTRQTVNNFFARRAVNKNIFQTICHELGLEWGDVAEFETEQLSASMNAAKNNANEIIQESSGTTQVLNPPVLETTEEKSTRTRKAMIVLSAKLTADNQAQLQDKKIEVEAIVAHLRQLVGDVTLTIKDIEDGSIKITLEGSSEGIERLQELFESGNLTEVLGIPVEDIQIENGDDSDNNESTQSKNQNPVSRRNFKPIRLLGYLILGCVICTSLTDADLNHDNLSRANLSRADLSHNNLSRADLSRADLFAANLSHANLSLANLSHANLSRADLFAANLSDANLSRADLFAANLSDANLSRANLNNANLSDADLSDVNLKGANLKDANLRGANLRGANLSNAKLRGIKLHGANLSDVNLSGVNLREVNLSNTNIRNINLSGANLSSMNFNGANLIGMNFNGANLIGAKLRDVNLSGANLTDANLTDANLSGAILSGANLNGANLDDAIVMNALFGSSKGLTEDMKRDLERRGAIFGDRPPVLNPK